MKLILRNILFTTALMLSFQALYAAKVDTVETFSTVMNKTIKAVVITPDNYSKDKQYPVIYLLHGASGKNPYADWISKAPNIAALTDTYNLIIVCPDGNPTSWYFDSVEDPTSKYETYVSGELVKFIDTHYNTRKDRSGRAITGLSMGGHGALYLAFKHQDVYGAAGSMSGGVDIRPFTDRWDIAKRLGTFAQHPERWEQNTVVNMVPLVTPGSLALIIDCGESDFFLKVNQDFHQKLLAAKINHDFTTRPGGHSWDYWANSINYQALFMSRFFNKTK
ncbi:MAG TPA: XynC protein [Sphingobacteriaceae bacterium]|nr:XynC protein [Sphingobacteriaceae bacterium]